VGLSLDALRAALARHGDSPRDGLTPTLTPTP
jgi:hypothetical protein